MKKIPAIFVVFLPVLLLSQPQSPVDSLENMLGKATSDKDRIGILTDLAKHYSRNEHEKAHAFAVEAAELSEKISYVRGRIISDFYIALIYQYEGKYAEALEKFLAALELAETEQKQISGREADSLILQLYNSIGNNYSMQERREEGLVYYGKALSIAREKGMRKIEATVLGNMGNIFYYNSYDFEKGVWDTAGLHNTLAYYTEAVKIHRENNDFNQMISPMMNIALVQIELGKTREALDTLEKLKEICTEMNDVANLVYINCNIAQAHLVSDDLPEALKYFDTATAQAATINDRNTTMGIYAMISQAYSQRNDYKRAYEYHVKYSELKDSIVDEESTRSVSEMQAKYETEKKEKQIEMQSHELQKKQLVVYATSFGLLLMIMLAVVIFRGYKHKQKSSEIIAQQKAIVEEKNKNITDSILYASRIQGAILPAQDHFQRMFPESFIFYRPKDIVSGDFYWFSEKEEHRLLAVADCTGHGVPGAMMSMVGSGLLHQIVNEKTISNPSEVLSELDRQVIRSLKQKGAEGESREGMDICLIDINKENLLMRFSGANRPLYFLRDGILKELEGSKYPIGSIMRKTKVFEVKEKQLRKGDCIYLATDGFSDQFGEKTNKKFMSGRFKESLLAVHREPMEKQKEELMRIIDEWKGSYEQVDDICVIGIRV